MTTKNKIRVGAILLFILLSLLFVDRCTTINLTTSTIFQPRSYKNFKSLSERPTSEHYEIVPVKAYFPILFDSIRSEFYVANNQGLTKYDSIGNILFSQEIEKEKFTSVHNFSNFTPFVFSQKGVYDFSGEQLKYSAFTNIQNADNSLTPSEFKVFIEKYYKEADFAIFDQDLEVEQAKYAFPMYFYIKGNWYLLFAPQDEFRFSHQNSNYSGKDIFGQIDLENFPAKLGNKKLLVLKDELARRYSSTQRGEVIDDGYLDKYTSQILAEKKFNYNTSDKIKLLSRTKKDYYSSGSILDLPHWVQPSFMNTGYFQLKYKNEKLYFKETVMKYFGESIIKDELFLYELPKTLRKKSRVAFLHYGLDLGGFDDSQTNIYHPIIKNGGLYIIKPKN